MDLDKIIYELEEIGSVFRLFSCLSMEAQIKDVAIISLEYDEKVQNILKNIKQDM